MPMVPTHFAVYHAQDVSGYEVRPTKKHYYEFHLGRDFVKTLGGSTFGRVTQKPALVKSIKIPFAFKHEMGQVSSLFLGFSSQLPVGHIKYALTNGGKTAVSSFYEPKETLVKRGLEVSKLGYLLEWLSSTHLKSLGVTHVMTSDDPSPERIRQLNAVGLTHLTRVPIDEWIVAMRFGIKAKVRGERLRDKNKVVKP